MKSVPSFNFGEVEASQIYAGFADKVATADGALEVDDTRLGTSDWSLTANMGEFTDQNSNKLTGATLNLASTGSLGNTLAASIKDDASATDVTTGNGSHGVDKFSMTAADSKLTLAPNAAANLEKDAAFSTTINWNLSSTTPVAPTA